MSGIDISTLEPDQAKALFAADHCYVNAILPDESVKEFDLDKIDPALWTK